MKNTFLILAGLVTIVAVLPYLRDILKHKTKPNIVSWLTWSLLAGLAVAAQIGAHEYRAAIFSGAVMTETMLVVILGLKHGFVKYARFDAICQIGAIVGIILWQVFNDPLIGVMAAVIIDLIGALPTYRHSWLEPFEETWQTYALSGLGGLLALFGLISYNWTSLTYAVYIVAVNAGLTSLILYKGHVWPHPQN